MDDDLTDQEILKLFRRFSDLQRQIFERLLDGHSREQIAKNLGYSQQTVLNETSDIYQRFGLSQERGKDPIVGRNYRMYVIFVRLRPLWHLSGGGSRVPSWKSRLFKSLRQLEDVWGGTRQDNENQPRLPASAQALTTSRRIVNDQDRRIVDSIESVIGELREIQAEINASGDDEGYSLAGAMLAPSSEPLLSPRPPPLEAKTSERMPPVPAMPGRVTTKPSGFNLRLRPFVATGVRTLLAVLFWRRSRNREIGVGLAGPSPFVQAVLDDFG